MTVTFALAINDVGLVAADTRLNASFRDGRSGVKDSGPLVLTFSDGAKMTVGETYRKIRPVGRDWACGAGFFPLVEAGLAALSASQSTAHAESTLSDVRAREVARLMREFNTQQEVVERAAILFTRTSAGSTVLAGYRFDGTNPVPPGSQYIFQAPPELPPSQNALIVGELQNSLVTPSNPTSLYAVIRGVARAFSQVLPHSQTVSKQMEVGVTAGRTRYELLASMADVANASDRDMERFLNRS